MGFSVFIGPDRIGDDEETAEGWIRAGSVTESIQKVFGPKTAAPAGPGFSGNKDTP
jgi:hypothetical protein